MEKTVGFLNKGVKQVSSAFFAGATSKLVKIGLVSAVVMGSFLAPQAQADSNTSVSGGAGTSYKKVVRVVNSVLNEGNTANKAEADKRTAEQKAADARRAYDLKEQAEQARAAGKMEEYARLYQEAKDADFKVATARNDAAATNVVNAANRSAERVTKTADRKVEQAGRKTDSAVENAVSATLKGAFRIFNRSK